MRKLIKVKAVMDGHMEDGEQFCTEGKEYIVTDQSFCTFEIVDDVGVPHYFEDGDHKWFKLIYSGF